jgi:hypothetical protein
MNNKNRKTLKAIFTNPVPLDLEWKDIESLLIALGADVKDRRGVTTWIILKGIKGVFYEPRKKESCRCTVERVRELLVNAGEKPEQ